jgi:hypothetical protein
VSIKELDLLVFDLTIQVCSKFQSRNLKKLLNRSETLQTKRHSTHLDMRSLNGWNPHDASDDPNQHGNADGYPCRSPAAVGMEFSQRIDNREKSVAGECCESENGDANRQVLEEL